LKIKIEGDGHSVEIEGSALDHTLDKVTELAEEVWQRTKTERPTQTMGFGSQLMERGGTPHLKGDPTHQYGGPVEA
jgi:hypothetical protein